MSIEQRPPWDYYNKQPRAKASFESAYHHFVQQLEVAHALAPDEVMTLENLIENLKEIRRGHYRIINEVPVP